MFIIMHINQLFQSTEAWGPRGQLLMVYRHQASKTTNIILTSLIILSHMLYPGQGHGGSGAYTGNTGNTGLKP